MVRFPNSCKRQTLFDEFGENFATQTSQTKTSEPSPHQNSQKSFGRCSFETKQLRKAATTEEAKAQEEQRTIRSSEENDFPYERLLPSIGWRADHKIMPRIRPQHESSKVQHPVRGILGKAFQQREAMWKHGVDRWIQGVPQSQALPIHTQQPAAVNISFNDRHGRSLFPATGSEFLG